MLFQSWEYLVLLTISLLSVIFVRSVTIKQAAILIFSVIFYTYGGTWQILLFLLVITLAFFSGIIVSKIKNKYVFIMLICVLFFPLFLYKYIPFLLVEFLGTAAIPLIERFILPIGISFYTFQTVGYVIDVYRDSAQVERNYLTFACFVSFFPQLVAGPIERSSNLMPQIKKFEKPLEIEYSVGFRHILLGLCLKLLVAETMAEFVNPIYNNLSDKGGLAVLIATFCFGIQIYCDFNGYTQIAIGSAKLMGIDLMQNFDHPYRANSISVFWRKWHISLTTWFRDYVYIPLGGNRCGTEKMIRNTIITFFVSGIWHGANWTFALWGFANGVAIALEKQLNKLFDSQNKYSLFRSLVTYVSINLFWVLFRANSIQDALRAYQLIFFDTLPQLFSLNSLGKIMNFALRENGWSNSMILPLISSVFVYIWYEYGSLFNKDMMQLLSSNKWYVRWGIYILLILVTLFFGKTLEQSSFVYFRF